jgi:hypothetical protein
MNNRYGIERIENLTKKLSVICAVVFPIVAYFCKDDSGETLPFLWCLFLPLLFLPVRFLWTKEGYEQVIERLNLKKKSRLGFTTEPSTGYFLFHLYVIVLFWIAIALSVISVISYIMTGSIQTYIKD